MISQFDDLVWQAVDGYPAPLQMSREQWFALINSIIQKESTFNPNAVSYTGAGIGLMQVNPNIWLSIYGVTKDQLFDPWTNIQIGTQIAQDYIRRFGTSAGLGAFFAGPVNRLSSAAQSYARTVLGYYAGIIQKVRSLISFNLPKAGEMYFVPPSVSGSDQIAIDILPEAGEELEFFPTYETGNIVTGESVDDTWLWMVGLGLALVIWANR